MKIVPTIFVGVFNFISKAEYEYLQVKKQSVTKTLDGKDMDLLETIIIL